LGNPQRFLYRTNLPAGYLWDLSQLNVDGTIRVIGVTPPRVNPLVVSGGNLILTGLGGPPGAGYTWLTSTNVGRSGRYLDDASYGSLR